MNNVLLQAHRGVSTEYPENTMSAFYAAVLQGYEVIELDPGVTKDGKFVTLHDRTINRTGRHADGSAIEEEIDISDITYEEASKYDYGICFSNKFRGEKLPLLSEALDLAVKYDKLVKIDNKFRKFSPEDMEKFFDLLSNYIDNIAFTCYDMGMVSMVLERFPDAEIHYDGLIEDDTLEELSRLIKPEKLTVWVPYECDMTSWVKVPFANEALCSKIKKYAKLGVWILSENEDLDVAAKWGADIVETTGKLKHDRLKGARADMHNHTKHSHDGTSEVMDLCEAEVKAGNSIIAVTDHYDVCRYDTVDHHSKFSNVAGDIKEAEKAYDGKIEILGGIEAGEGVWHPKVTDEFIHSFDFDVVIGSVHSVRTPKTDMPFSDIDFSKYTEDEVIEYMDCYFHDVMDMLENTEMDIIAHIVSPLKYINGKYCHKIDSHKFEDKIEKILKFIIEHAIILEVNTSSLGSGYDEFMPEEWIIRKFKDMGGYLVSTGSDSHVPENAAKGFDRVYSLLKEIGFKHTFYVVNRHIMHITL